MNGFNNRTMFSITETDPPATFPPAHQIKLPRLPSHSPLHLAFSHRQCWYIVFYFFPFYIFAFTFLEFKIKPIWNTLSFEYFFLCTSKWPHQGSFTLLRVIPCMLSTSTPLFVYLCSSYFFCLCAFVLYTSLASLCWGHANWTVKTGKDWFMFLCSPLTGTVLRFYVSWWGWGQRLITKVPFISALYCEADPDVCPH